MDFELNESQRLIQHAARDYAQKHILPLAAEADRNAIFPTQQVKGLADLGLMGVNVPESLGGSAAGVVAYSVAMQEVARACASTAVTMSVTNMVAEVITYFGSEAQKAKYVPKLCSGEYVAGSFALSENAAGSDPGAMQTRAVKKGDRWLINGAKQWITSGDKAGVMIVWARTGQEGTRGISCFLVEQGTKGLSVSRKEDKMGLCASSTVSLSFEDCEVPEDALLSTEGAGFKIAMMALDGGRIGIASQALGIASAAHDEAVAYAKERKQFGHPIADFQAIQWMIADGKTELETARLLTLRAAWLKEHGLPFGAQAAMAKLYASESAGRICDSNLQIHGGSGYVKDFAAERHVRDVRVTRIYEGTSEIQRTVIGRSVLSAR